jgi:hypothetical protein
MSNTEGEAKDDRDARPEKGHVQILLTRELNSALTAKKGRTQLLRRRLRQGDDTACLEADLEAIGTEPARLTTIVERITPGDAGS